jgi:hypothetical protein
MYTPGIGSISGAIHLFARRPFVSSMIIALAIMVEVVRMPAGAPPPLPPAPPAPVVTKSDGVIHYSLKHAPSYLPQKTE